LKAGKHVLCEKPLTLNAAEAVEVRTVARGTSDCCSARYNILSTDDHLLCAIEKGRFVMEALFSRFIPALVKVREIIAAGTIGEVKMVQADLGMSAPDFIAGLYDKKLGGGALVCVGKYHSIARV
jgi:dihydrodiol dehydrogenase / D-xylose 1-dehydrogenase (NADP)